MFICITTFSYASFLGEEKVRSYLGELTKQDELLKKTVVPKRPTIDRKSGGGSKAGTSGGGNRSRSPGRYNRNSGGGKNNHHNKRSTRGKSGGSSPRRAKVDDDSGEETVPKDKRKGSGNPKGKNQSKKGEYPSSFLEAWPTFFSASALLLVTAVGIVCDNIPTLDSLPLGGRLRHCIDNWKVVLSKFVGHGSCAAWIQNSIEVSSASTSSSSKTSCFWNSL